MRSEQNDIPHVQNVEIIKEATTSRSGVTGFDGRYTLPLGISLLTALAGIAYLLS